MNRRIILLLSLLVMFFGTQILAYENTSQVFTAMSRGEVMDDIDLEEVVSVDPFLTANFPTINDDEATQIVQETPLSLAHLAGDCTPLRRQQCLLFSCYRPPIQDLLGRLQI